MSGVFLTHIDRGYGNISQWTKQHITAFSLKNNDMHFYEILLNYIIRKITTAIDIFIIFR